MKVVLTNSSPEAVRLVKDYFPGIEISEDSESAVVMTTLKTVEDAISLIRYLRKIAPYYLQEYVEDPEDYEERDKR